MATKKENMFNRRKKHEKSDWLGCSPEMHERLEGHPQIPSSDIRAKPHATKAVREVSVPLERVWAIKGFESFIGDNTKVLPSGDRVPSLEYANGLRGTVATDYNPNDPIVLTPFADTRGSIGYRVAEGRHRVLAAIGGGEMVNIVADVHSPQKDIEMDYYPGIVATEQGIILKNGNQ